MKDQQFPLHDYCARTDNAVRCIFHNDNAEIPSLSMDFVPIKPIKVLSFRYFSCKGESLEALEETSLVVVASEGPNGVPCGVVCLDFRRDEGGVEDEVLICHDIRGFEPMIDYAQRISRCYR